MSKSTEAPVTPGSKFDNVVRAVIEIRDKRAEIKQKYEDALKEEDGPLAEKEEKLRNWLHQRLLDSGANSMKASSGTVFFSETQKVTVNDWESFYETIRQTGDIGLLERRASKSNVVEYMKQNNGELPGGVSLSVDRNLNVRKSSK